ncbi:MAG: FkbM family methyltransferase [Planctomycetes bacterium]|nr:FkbM family methyltransferase [Planctomycetota bacterium]
MTDTTTEHLRPGRLARYVASHRRGRVVRRLAALCRQYLQWFANANYDIDSNGESFVLSAIRPFGPRVILDVGANVGHWCRTAKGFLPEAEVHAFEIAPPTCEALRRNVADLPGVHCEATGLSDEPGELAIRYYPDLPALTTSIAYDHPYASRELVVPVTTGDEFLRRRGIARVDLLKIDTEGMEHRVLKGFRRALTDGRIDLVQFEYGQASIVTGFLLRDYHRMLGELGYAVGKIYPNHVDFRDYRFADEDFVGPNYLACRRDRTDLLGALAHP